MIRKYFLITQLISGGIAIAGVSLALSFYNAFIYDDYVTTLTFLMVIVSLLYLGVTLLRWKKKSWSESIYLFFTMTIGLIYLLVLLSQGANCDRGITYTLIFSVIGAIYIIFIQRFFLTPLVLEPSHLARVQGKVKINNRKKDRS